MVTNETRPDDHAGRHRHRAGAPSGIVWPQLMAGGLIAGLPLIVVFVFFQSQIVRGVAHTGLAGQ